MNATTKRQASTANGDAIGLPRPVEDGVAGLLPINLFRRVYVCNSNGYVVFD